MEKETINIFFASGDRYIKYTDVAIHSIKANASKNYKYNIIILTQDTDTSLSAHNDENFNIQFANINSEIESIKPYIPSNYGFHLDSFNRFFIEKMFPNIDKAIYLDGDIVVQGDISKLYNIDLKDNLLAAVNEQNCFLNPLMTQYTEVVAGIDPHKFFNTGVMLLNLKEIRKFNLKQKFLDMLDKYHFESPMMDQDYLNNLCRKRVMLLPNSWNYESVPNYPLEGELYIRHFAFGAKPWLTKNTENADLWWEYAKKSQFYDVILAEFNRITPQDLQRGMMHAAEMMQLAQRLINSDHTFKKVIIDKEDK